MANAELKTKRTNESVSAFIHSIEDPIKVADCLLLIEIMSKVTESEAVMWGSSIVGFGNFHYKYESGRENDWFRIGFSPRKQNITIYSMAGFLDDVNLLTHLGKFKLGKGCLYIKCIKDVDVTILTDILKHAVDSMD